MTTDALQPGQRRLKKNQKLESRNVEKGAIMGNAFHLAAPCCVLEEGKVKGGEQRDRQGQVQQLYTKGQGHWD